MSFTPIQKWLESYCQESARVAGGMVLLADPNAAETCVATVAKSGSQRQEELRLAAGNALKQQVPVALDPSIVSLPLGKADQPVGAIALELTESGTDARREILADLENASRALATALAENELKEPVVNAGRVLQLQATLLTHASFREAATALATELATTFKLDHVAIGFNEGKFSRVEAVSNFADFEETARVFRIISIAMDEAIEQGAAVTYPGIPDDRPRINVAQAELGKSRGCVVCSVPLVDKGEIIGAVTLERSGTVPMSREEVTDFEQIMCMVGPVLGLQRELERPLTWRARKAARAFAEKLLGPGQAMTKIVGTVVIAAVSAMFLVSTDYRIGSPARLEGAIQRALVAPADGFVKNANVRPGDEVKAGQVLIELAQDDLELERRKWQSELEQHENAAPAALARDDRGEFVISRARADEARAKLGLVEEQIARSQVRAPFDGIVITGDLSQMLGAPVRRGDTLVTVSPSGEFRLILEIDERDISDLAVGQAGRLALGALPDSSFAFEVLRVSPVAQTRDGRNYFEVEAALQQAVPNMRPGLQGVAKVDVDQRTIAWVLFHRVIDWARIGLWSMGIGS